MSKSDIILASAKEIIKPVYEDGLRPATQEIGKSLQTVSGVINVALMPISLMVHGFKEIELKLKNDLSHKLSGTSKEKIRQPQLNIVGPLIEKYKYSHDKESLSDMFVSLLANSMDSEKYSVVHPAFVDIISQLSSDEAKLFKTIAIKNGCPKLDIAIENPDDKGFNIFRRNFIGIEVSSGLQYPDNISAYIDNLSRLSLINYTTGSIQDKYSDDLVYKSLKEDELVKNLEKILETRTEKIKIFEGIISVSDFGKNFYEAVTRQNIADK